jgi:serine phosphatase RsbU (regulator of sigma subunit)/anti-sigma regulatory factor (Ser/Thr protein kinase)
MSVRDSALTRPATWEVDPRRPRPERRLDLYAAVGVAGLASVAYVIALLLDVVPPRGLSVVFFSAAPITAAFALLVLGVRWRAERDPALAWVSAGLAVGWLAMTLQLISFPTVAPDGGVLGTGDQSSAALYLTFHLALAGGAIAGALGAPLTWRWPAAVVGMAFTILMAVDMVPLPTLLRRDTSFTGPLLAIEYSLAALTALAAVLWIRRTGRVASTLRGWVGVALSLAVYDLLFNAFAAERFDAIWWASLSLRVATYSVLAIGAVASVLIRLSETESYTQSELDRREGELRTSLGLTSQLLGCAQDLAKAVTPVEVAEALCRDAVAASGLRRAVVLVSREGEPTAVLGHAGYGSRPGDELAGSGWDAPYASTFAPLAREPLFLESAEAVRARVPAVGSPLEEASVLVVLPIRVAGQRLGTLLVWDTEPRTLEQNQREVLTGQASQGGQALRRALAFESEANAASTLQRSLLSPTLPARDDLPMAARYVPGEAGLRVGGDWYDCVPVDGHKVALVVGDVMGKGLRAAAVMGQMRTAVRSLASADPSPAAVLSGLDRLHSMLEVDEIATVAYVLLDAESGVARMARAGHLPPILVDLEGRATLLEEGGSPPLGTPGPQRVEAEVRVPPGSVLALYTDGIVEDRASGLDGLEAFVDLVGETARRKGSDVEALATELLVLTSANQRQDDIALLVARLPSVPMGGGEEAAAEPALSRAGAPAAPGETGREPLAQPQGLQPVPAVALAPHESAHTGAGAVHVGRVPSHSLAPYESTFPQSPQTAAEVRRWIRQSSHGLDRVLREDTVLLATELVTNAVRHGHGDVSVRLWPGPDVVRVEVSDASPHRPEPGDLDLDAEDGRGLLIVGALSSRWGTAPLPGGAGKAVWFELDR